MMVADHAFGDGGDVKHAGLTHRSLEGYQKSLLRAVLISSTDERAYIFDDSGSPSLAQQSNASTGSAVTAPHHI